MGKKAAAISSSSFFFILMGSVYLTISRVKNGVRCANYVYFVLHFVITVYLFLQFFPFSFHTLIPWLYPKVFWEVDRPKAGDIKEFTFIWHHCFHQSILTYCHFVLSRTSLLLFESIRSVQNALWRLAGAGQHQLLTGAVEHADWHRNCSSLEEGTSWGAASGCCLGRATWIIPCHFQHGSVHSWLK